VRPVVTERLGHEAGESVPSTSAWNAARGPSRREAGRSRCRGVRSREPCSRATGVGGGGCGGGSRKGGRGSLGGLGQRGTGPVLGLRTALVMCTRRGWVCGWHRTREERIRGGPKAATGCFVAVVGVRVWLGGGGGDSSGVGGDWGAEGGCKRGPGSNRVNEGRRLFVGLRVPGNSQAVGLRLRWKSTTGGQGPGPCWVVQRFAGCWGGDGVSLVDGARSTGNRRCSWLGKYVCLRGKDGGREEYTIWGGG